MPAWILSHEKEGTVKTRGLLSLLFKERHPFWFTALLKSFYEHRHSGPPPLPLPLRTRRTRVFNRYKISPDLSSSRSNVLKNVPLNWTIFLFFRRKRYLDEKFGKFSVMKINHVISAARQIFRKKKKSHMEYYVSIWWG